MSAPGMKVLVLDFGGVVSRTLFETHDLSEQSLGLPAGTLTWKGPFDPEGDPLWQAMQRDEITERDYWHRRTREVGHLVGEDWQDMQSFVQRARGADPDAVIRPEARQAIEAVHAAGYRLAILSNELDLFYGADFRGKLPLLKHFELVVDATHTGILKPDPRAYRMIEDALGVPLSACVFVDDQLRNVLGAQRVGMQTVHFDVTNPTKSYNEALAHFGLAAI
jgi:putative hydrolase of the HAD superfamily